MADINQTVSRRSKPKSRTALHDEQSYPWKFLHLQDPMIRHRGVKHSHRYELLKSINLLSLEYLLSVTRCHSHSLTPDHYNLHITLPYTPAQNVSLTVKHLSSIINYSCLMYSSVTLSEAFAPNKLTIKHSPCSSLYHLVVFHFYTYLHTHITTYLHNHIPVAYV